jgi:hypothetical protein
MTSKLNDNERELLQRSYDGALSKAEAEQAEALLEKSASARVFVAALEELTIAAKAAESIVWERAAAPSADDVVDHALGAASLSDASIADLAPLLERFHDGETTPEEEATVHALLRERDDVADYIAELEGLRAGIEVGGQALADAVDFGGFFDAVAAKIDAAETDFDHDHHRVLLYRYNDGEATDAEVAQVESWLDAGHPEVTNILAALSEMQVATTCAIELAQEQVDLTDFWHGVEEAIDDEIESQGDNVVSLGRKRSEKNFFQKYQQAIVGAVAAVLVLGVAGMFSDQLFGPRETRVIEKTIVVVEEVEYAPGTTGAVLNPPVQQASVTIDNGDPAAEEEQEPTVIWVFEDDAPSDEPASNDDADTMDAPSKSTEEDAGSYGGQPI